jgi:Protein of unknown function (DUF1566)
MKTRLLAIFGIGLITFLGPVCCDDDSASDAYGDLEWQNPPGEDEMEWNQAVSYCESLDLDGHTDWRLPSVSELRSLIRGCPANMTGGACGVTDDCVEDSCWSGICDADCQSSEGPGTDGCYWDSTLSGSCRWYWTSSSFNNEIGGFAWFVNFNTGFVGYYGRLDTHPARCVRGES